jgi:toxin secretion/phage lysis holin
MDKLFNSISIITGVVGGVVAAFFGSYDKVMCTLVILMVLDYIAGVIKAVYTKSLSSEIGFKGLLKKIAMLVIVALANTIQNLMGGNVAVREIVIMFYIANEGISILENAAVILPQMPEKLKDILLQLRGDNNENRH